MTLSFHLEKDETRERKKTQIKREQLFMKADFFV